MVSSVAFTRGARGAAVVGDAITVLVETVAADFCTRRAGCGAGEIGTAAVLIDAIATAVVTTRARRTIRVIAVGIEGEHVAHGDRIAVRTDNVVRRIAVAVRICVAPVDGIFTGGIGICRRLGIRHGYLRLTASRIQHHALPDPIGSADEVRVVRTAIGTADLVTRVARRAVHLWLHRIWRSRIRLPGRVIGQDRRSVEVATRDEHRGEQNVNHLHASSSIPSGMSGVVVSKDRRSNPAKICSIGT